MHSIGINDNPNIENYHKIDLSITNTSLEKQLKKLPKPDIIIASPPCESWSIADSGSRMVKDIWVIRNREFYIERNKIKTKHHQRCFYQKDRGRILGESTQAACLFIIEKFKPSIWIIENPKTSLCWKYQEQHLNLYGFKNWTYYSNYNENFSLKPTIFKSNIKLDLKQNYHSKRNKEHFSFSNYDVRSMIPEELIIEIFNQIKRHII